MISNSILISHRFVFLLLFGLFLSSCNSRAALQKSPIDDGEKKAFASSYDHTVAATAKALYSRGLVINSSWEDDKGTAYMISNFATNPQRARFGRVVIKKTTDNQTEVIVRWEKSIAFSIIGAHESDFSAAIFSSIEHYL